MAHLVRPISRRAASGITYHELFFRVMNADAHVIVVEADANLAIWASDRAAALEDAWSRFTGSELASLNERAGTRVHVTEETFRLVEASRTAWRSTGGAFDPTVLEAVRALGYDRSFDEVVAGTPGPASAAAPTPGLDGLDLDPDARTVQLPMGVGIDPGGIGKGLAADLIVDGLLALGAEGALVNLGGDCRCEGTPVAEHGWEFGVEDPFDPDHDLARVVLTGGGVATSSTRRRRWKSGGVDVHHLIDPTTGSPTDAGVRSATVVAGQGWWAEAEAKMLVVAGPSALDRLEEASAIVVMEDESVITTPDLAGAVLRP